MKAKNFSRFSELIPQAIRETLLSEGINPEIMDDYFSAAGALCFAKTNGAKPVAWLNKGSEAAEIYSEQYTSSAVVQTETAKKANRRSFIALSGDNPKHPHELFYKMLGERFKKPVIRSVAQGCPMHPSVANAVFSVWQAIFRPLRSTGHGFS